MGERSALQKHGHLTSSYIIKENGSSSPTPATINCLWALREGGASPHEPLPHGYY